MEVFEAPKRYARWWIRMGVVKVGVVGVGHLGVHHARIYAELLGAELVGVVDKDEQRAVSVARQYRTAPFTDYLEFFEVCKPDAVSVVVPTTLHYEVVKEALERGIHVLVEKPVTTTVEEAMDLLETAKRRNLVLQVGHIERFNPGVQFLRSRIKDPILIHCQRMSPFSNRNNDVGVVLDLMIHDIDIVLSLVESSVRDISACGSSVFTDQEDVASVQMSFRNGCVANLLASRVSHKRIRELQLVQRDSYLVLNYDSQEISIYRTYRDERSSNLVETIEKPLIPKNDQLKQELAHFLYCVHEGRPPLVGIEDGKRALEVAIEVVNKIKSKVAV